MTRVRHTCMDAFATHLFKVTKADAAFDELMLCFPLPVVSVSKTSIRRYLTLMRFKQRSKFSTGLILFSHSGPPLLSAPAPRDTLEPQDWRRSAAPRSCLNVSRGRWPYKAAIVLKHSLHNSGDHLTTPSSLDWVAVLGPFGAAFLCGFS